MVYWIILLVLAVAVDTYSFADHFINNGRWVLSDEFNFFVFLLDSVPVVYSAQGYLSQISIDG